MRIGMTVSFTFDLDEEAVAVVRSLVEDAIKASEGPLEAYRREMQERMVSRMREAASTESSSRNPFDSIFGSFGGTGESAEPSASAGGSASSRRRGPRSRRSGDEPAAE